MLHAFLRPSGLGRRRAGGRAGFTLIELLVVVVIIGILATVSAPAFQNAMDRARNANVQSNANVIRQALEEYAAEYNGAYPDANYPAPSGKKKKKKKKGSVGRGTSAELDGLEDFLPDSDLPLSPWGREPQEVWLMPTSPLVNASDVANKDGLLTPIGRTHASGGRVADPPTATDHFGAISYSYAPDNQVYVLYGIGKKQKKAIVSGAVSNFAGF